MYMMAGITHRHGLSYSICSILLAISLLCTATGSVTTVTTNVTGVPFETDLTTDSITYTTHTTTSPNQPSNTYATLDHPSTSDSATVKEKSTTTQSTTPSAKPTTEQADKESDPSKETPAQKAGSMAVAGVILLIFGLLLVAVNGYVFFKSKKGSCTTKKGIFHVLQMSSIQKNNEGDNDDDDDVEDNFKDDVDVEKKSSSSRSLDKEGTTDQEAEPKFEVHVKVETDIEGGVEDANKPNGNADVNDSNAAPEADVAEKSTDNDVAEKSTDNDVEKTNETVVEVTIEGGSETQTDP
ncbi:uncharacterized protein LOC121430909 [Lytechinus variegatus]|uniref:uncharacterized protein LOC121430909 n=1 Tax=Lytechinus variegatus TaxID=7654 RepID=UPI001BB23C5C|nr:uncharacterized protein LOC121430909 [Lytechinus variegatus]